jgi:putative nucleotidyltransferase with HDIG domain
MSDPKWGISRERALELMKERLDKDSLQKHCLASEAIMRSLAPRFGEDPEMWGLVGLLHDLDYEDTKDRMDQHGLITAEILGKEGVAPEVTEAIKYHNAQNLGLQRTAPIHFALSAGETITGMIVAAALVNPDKKISSVKVKSVKKRMKAKEFARSVNRDQIKLCEQIDIPLDEFIGISLESMAAISDELGL